MIVHLVCTFGNGGLAQYSYNLCRTLSNQGVRVELITAPYYELKDLPHNFDVAPILDVWDPQVEEGPAGTLAGLVRKLGKGLRYIRAMSRALRYARERKADILHWQEFYFAVDLFFVEVARRFGIRQVYTAHNTLPFDWRANVINAQRKDAGALWVQRQLAVRQNAIIVHSEHGRGELQDYYGIEPDRITALPFGEYTFLAEDRMPNRAAARRSVGVPDRGPVVLFFGHLRKYKGLKQLICAFAKVRELVPDAILLIAGSSKKDTDSRAFRRLVADLGLENGVKFHLRYIPHAEVPNYFVSADVVALPYVAISQSAVLQAAYAFSRPVVATSVGGLTEAVLDGESGLLVPPADVPALAEAIGTLLQDPSRARAMGEKGRRLAETAHSWEEIGRRIKKLYEQVMS